VEAL
jgi:hypothetical protein